MTDIQSMLQFYIEQKCFMIVNNHITRAHTGTVKSNQLQIIQVVESLWFNKC